MAKGNSQKSANGSVLDFEAQLWATADKMRGHMNLAAGAPVSDPASFKVTVTNAPDRRSALRFTKWCPIQRNADSFRADLHPDLKADFVPARKDLANPPFNMSDLGDENLRQDVRWKFGMPPVNNAR